MKGKKRSSPAAGEFLFEIDAEPLEESLTALGGVPLLLRDRRNEHYEAMLRPFRHSHVLYRKFAGYELWVKADLVAAGRRAAPGHRRVYGP